MSTPYRILIAFDFSECSVLAFAEALTTLRRSADPELHIVSVVNKEAAEIVPVADRHASLVQITDNLRERLTASQSTQAHLAEALVREVA